MLQINQKADYFHIESVVQEAVERLQHKIGCEWLSPSALGENLTPILQHVIEEKYGSDGWQVWIDKPIRQIITITSKPLDMTLSHYLGKDDLAAPGSHLYWLNGDYINSKLNVFIGDLIPDLVVMAPNNEMCVWDLTSKYADEHMSKTILFADILSSQAMICNIGETSWAEFEGRKHVASA